MNSAISALNTTTEQIAVNTSAITAINTALDTKLTYVSGELSNVDFNDYKTAGCFDVTDVSEAMNCPSSSAGTLYIIASPYCCVQQYITKDTMFIRSFTDNDWTNWSVAQSLEISGNTFVEDFGFDG
jgi:hypothetical protein